jgi:ATP-dependent protease ClpP protease subunit
MKTALYVTLVVSIFVGVSYVFSDTSKKHTNTSLAYKNFTASTIAASPTAQTDQYQVAKKTVYNVTLSEENTVVIIGTIGEEAISIANRITELGQTGKPVYVYINSPGGSVLDGAQIVNAIQVSKVPVYTIDGGLAASMAAIIFEAGTKRLMVDRTILMFHEASGQVGGSFNQIKSRFHVFDRLVGKMDYEIARRVGMNPETFRNLLPSELWLDAEDAVNQNFADGLVNVKIQTTSKSSFQEKLTTSSQIKSLNPKVNINYDLFD